MTARYRCGADALTDTDTWLWLRLDAASVRDLPAGWHLLVDQTRFERIAILTVAADGVHRLVRTPAELTGRGAPGGMLKFDMHPAGREIRGLYLGFQHIDDLSLMRKIRAVGASEQAKEDARWLVLMGVFVGTLLSALLYNIVIHAGQRYAFQGWYLLWVSLAFAYGMVWTNVASFAVPGLVGPVAVRLDYVLVGLMIAAGNMFFFAVLEERLLPRWLVRGGHLLAAAGAVLGFVAATDALFPAVLTDRWLNYAVASTAIWVGLSSAVAARRGSRVIWFYLIGWGPVICVFLARLARNLGLMPQHDAVDMATFAALAFEALVLSLAIADRFRMVRRELDQARQRREIDRIEAKALRRAAHTDFLTGLGNRTAFQEAIRGMIERDMPFSLFLIDVDFLKDANDRLGHAGGDALLQRIATALSEVAQAGRDTQVARIGGDEFAMLFPGDLEQENAVAERIADLQGEPWQHMSQGRVISLSIGSARFPEDGEASEPLYQNADLALYNAKRLGRSRHCRYDPLLRILRDMQVEFTADADKALQRGEFRLHLQPIMNLGSESCCGYEALLRWDHPEHGLMLPDRFAHVLVAEKIGTRIQEHVLELALTRLRDHGDQIAMLSVNFTSAQLAGPRAARRVLDRLAHYGLSPSSLCIEVTEGVMLDRAADTILVTLKTLHKAGVCIALDDFGTGFASLVHLRQMPVDRIKIDRSFVAGLAQGNGGTLTIVRAIIGMGRGLGKVVVAEGIETEAQAELLRELGCHLGQGFLYGRAAPELLRREAAVEQPVAASTEIVPGAAPAQAA
ncbi:putative bifunctional diguanylate cyclase/phosphodiesterase [Sphingomonas sp. S2-65]|uniref:putative bifunctional diguanylate cyclase/phosphodiesterase n=1 Tax=Sphingomonas sp. S2-65 TaxID=2903960 RepID=UPI001F3CBEC5|nr:EAL domain-containing protein [Sphingomonas sp. S2-65]UYY59481.1 EAL domain-containing protein [Sphingomonas sp. S2-65]